MDEAFHKVNGAPVKTPSGFEYGIADNSASDAGRVQDGNDTMYKNRTSRKRYISLKWSGTTPEETSAILKAFAPEYIMYTYHDAEENAMQTREFYTGDKKASMRIWTVNNKQYSQISFDLIER